MMDNGLGYNVFEQSGDVVKEYIHGSVGIDSVTLDVYPKVSCVHYVCGYCSNFITYYHNDRIYM